MPFGLRPLNMDFFPLHPTLQTAAIVVPLPVYLTFSAHGRCWASVSGTVCPDSQVHICVWTDDETSSLGHRSYGRFMEEEGV